MNDITNAIKVAAVIATATVGAALEAATAHLNSHFAYVGRTNEVFAIVDLHDFADGDKAWRLEALEFIAEQFGGEYGFSRMKRRGTLRVTLPAEQGQIVDLYECLSAALS